MKAVGRVAGNAVGLVTDRPHEGCVDDGGGAQNAAVQVVYGLVVPGVEVLDAGAKTGDEYARCRIEAGCRVARKIFIGGIDLPEVTAVEADARSQPGGR